jgi:hypothetical protein
VYNYLNFINYVKSVLHFASTRTIPSLIFDFMNLKVSLETKPMPKRRRTFDVSPDSSFLESERNTPSIGELRYTFITQLIANNTFGSGN